MKFAEEDSDLPCSLREDFRFNPSAPRDRPLIMGHDIPPELKNKLDLISSVDRRLDVAMGAMLADVLAADDDGRAVSVSLNRDFYVGLDRYCDSMRYATVREALSTLEGLGLIAVEKGLTWAQGGRGKQTRFWPTERLREAAGDAPLLTMKQPRELVVLKDADKKLVTYRDTEQTDRWRRETREINEAIASVDIRVAAADVDWQPGRVSIPNAVKQQGDGLAPLILRPDSIVLRRSFNNGSWKEGGRYYGHWSQRLSKGRRNQVTIDGVEVDLLDFKASHIGILYSWADAAFDCDPYDIEGVERDMVKLGLLIALNAETDHKARHALAHEIMSRDERFENARHARKCHLEEAKRILEAIKLRHKPIAPWFCSGVGVRLQFEEAEVLRRVMVRGRKQGIITLPVHDELIVAKGRASDSVQDLMVRCWGERFGSFPTITQ